MEESLKKYAKWMREADDERWLTFSGGCLLSGIELGLTFDQIMEYIMETYHASDIDCGEVPLTVVEIQEDMVLYFG